MKLILKALSWLLDLNWKSKRQMGYLNISAGEKDVINKRLSRADMKSCGYNRMEGIG